MRLLLPLLLLSIIANVVLALQPTRRAHTEATAMPTTRTTAAAPAEPHASLHRTSANNLPGDLRSAIAQRNPKALLHALRRAGFPERYAHDMVLAEINSIRSEVLHEQALQEAAAPFWRLSAVRVHRMTDFRDLNRVLREEVRETFDGKPPNTNSDAYAEAQYRFLPADKISRVAQIDADYGQMFTDTMLERRGGPIDNNMIKLLEEERRADLAQVLSPQELELYDLHLSPAAQSLRRTLGEFQPTETEFRAMVAARTAFERERGNVTMAAGNVIHILSNNDPRALENYRGVLSPERFKELQRTHNPGYRAAAEIARHYNLPANAATETYVIQQSYEQRIRDARSAAGSDRAAGQAAARALAAEARTEISKVLGDAGTEVYLQTGGEWLGSLLRPPSPPSRIPNTDSAIRLPGGG